MDSEGMATYPNPAKDRIDIEFNQNGSTGGIVEIIILNGQTVKKVEIHSHKASLNIEFLKSGIYLLYLETEKGITVHKFIKE